MSRAVFCVVGFSLYHIFSFTYLPNELAKTLIENDTFVALLQEPYVVQNKMVGLPPMIGKYHSEEQNFKASICYSKNLQIFPVPQFTDQLVATCVWHMDLRGAAFRDLYIVSA